MRVSILVFLEPLLRHWTENAVHSRTRRVSILVFLEPLLRPRSWTKYGDEVGSFNPCFSGTTT